MHRLLPLSLLLAGCPGPMPLMCSAIGVHATADVSCTVTLSACTDDAVRQVDCAREGALLNCACIADDELVTTFFSEDYCDRVIGDDAEEIRLATVQGCPWDIQDPDNQQR